MLHGGRNIKKYLPSSLPNKEEQQTFWEYFGYADTGYAVSEIPYPERKWWNRKVCGKSFDQHVVGHNSAFLYRIWNKRFYATGMYGKLLNACDIPCKAMEKHRCIKKLLVNALIYEKRDRMLFISLLMQSCFSTNEES